MSVASSMSSSSPGEWQGFFFLEEESNKKKGNRESLWKVCLFVCFWSCAVYREAARINCVGCMGWG